MNLPRELRLKILKYLLPDELRIVFLRGVSHLNHHFRRDGGECYPQVARANKQLYVESKTLIYNRIYCIRVSSSWIRFLDIAYSRRQFKDLTGLTAPVIPSGFPAFLNPPGKQYFSHFPLDNFKGLEIQVWGFFEK